LPPYKLLLARCGDEGFTPEEVSLVRAMGLALSLTLRMLGVLEAMHEQAALLKLLKSVAIAANEATSVDEALQTCLDRVCAHTGWPVGHAYLVQSGSVTELESSGCWHLGEGERFEGFRRVTDRTRFLPGVGLPGRVLISTRPAWITDVTTDPNFPRAASAAEAGIKAAFAFPVLAEGEVAGVLEFFSTEGVPPDDGLLESMAQVGVQVGRVVERRRAGDTLRASEERIRAIVETANDAFVGMDSDGIITDWNRQAEATFGWSRGEVVGRRVAETIIPGQYREAHRRGLRHLLDTGEGPVLGKAIELTALHRDGHEFPVELTVWATALAEGRSFSAFIKDITERRRAQKVLRESEEAIRIARDQAVEASRLKSQFLANMSHEIRTPMNGVLGMAQLLLDTDLDLTQRDYLLALRESGQNLLAIINNILDFSKVEAGKVELEEIDFDLPTVVESVISLLASPSRTKGLALELDISSKLPRWVRGDPIRLRQILTNLTGNAVKFTDKGRIAVRVAPIDAERVRFEVIDTGIGIDPATRASLFHPFTQADASTTRRFGGTGLGLAISRQLVDLMGGSFDYNSQPGKGSTFWFEIPLTPTAPPELAPTPGPPAAEAIGTEARAGAAPFGVRVLLVEDSSVNQLVARVMLERLGYRVDVSSNGAEAVDAVQTTRYDAVLMDCLMPVMDGYEATARIRRLAGPSRGTPIIAVTASAMSGDREKCLLAGMDDYVSKPLDPTELAAALARCDVQGGTTWNLCVSAPKKVYRDTSSDRADHGCADDLSNLQRPALLTTRSVEPDLAPTLEGPLDGTVLDGLRQLGGPGREGFFTETVELFLTDAAERIRALRDAINLKDATAAARVAHSLKGACDSLGARRLADLCRQFEGSPDPIEAHELFAFLQAEFKRVEDALGQELAGGR